MCAAVDQAISYPVKLHHGAVLGLSGHCVSADHYRHALRKGVNPQFLSVKVQAAGLEHDHRMGARHVEALEGFERAANKLAKWAILIAVIVGIAELGQLAVTVLDYFGLRIQ